MHSGKHQGRAAGANGLAAGRLGRQADLLNADFIAQPFCLPPRGDTLSVSCVTSPCCDATSWKSTHTQRGTLVFILCLSWSAADRYGQRLQVARAWKSLGRVVRFIYRGGI